MRRLAGGEVATHDLTLAAGDYAHVEVEQRGIDVLVRLYAPDGTLLTEVDSPTGTQGAEELSTVAVQTGTYRLEVSSLKAEAEPGEYALTVEARPARRADRQRVAAERAFAAAERLLSAGDAAQMERAVGLYDEAIGLWRGLGDDASLAAGLRQSGEALLRRDTPEAPDLALARFRSALELFVATGDTADEAMLENRIAGVERRRGHLEAAAVEQRRSVERFRAAGDARNLAAARANLGAVYRELGSYQAALEIYQEMLEEQRRSGDRRGEAGTLVNFGYLMLDLGRADSADEAFARSATLYRELDLPDPVAVAQKGMADAAYQAGRLDDALALIESSLAERRRSGRPRDVAVALNSLGNVHWKRGETAAAETAYRAALDLLEGTQYRPDEATTRVDLARLLVPHRPAEAAELYRRALADFEAMGDRRGAAACHLGIAWALREQARTVEALEESGRAVAVVQALRRELPGFATGAAYRSFRQEYFELQIDLLMRRAREEPDGGFEARAFEAAERGRAEGLRDFLAAARGSAPPDAASPLVAERDRLRREVEALATAPPPEASATAPRLSRLLLRLDDLEARIDETMRTAEPVPESLGLEEIQRRVLDDDTVLLAYALGERRSFLWRVSRGGLESFELPPRPRIEDLVRRALLRLQSPSAADQRLAIGPMAELSSLLLAPVAERLDDKRLLVVADGALHLLPFAALPQPSFAGDGAAPPLVFAHEVINLPSASTLATLRRRLAHRSPAPGLMAIVADPVYGRGDPRFAAGGGQDDAAPAVAPQPFERLAGSSAEAAAIAALARPARCLLERGWDANRQRVLAGDLSGYRIVHFATHGLLDRSHPELSGLVLSLIDRQGRSQQGFLRSVDVASLDLPAELVVLSACETGLGEQMRGEGLVGLGHSFMRAGAARLMVSLWRVGDRGTRELMIRFYGGLLDRGLAPSAALREAQVSLARDPEWSSPYNWAAFVMQGEWRGFTIEGGTP